MFLLNVLPKPKVARHVVSFTIPRTQTNNDNDNDDVNDDDDDDDDDNSFIYPRQYFLH